MREVSKPDPINPRTPYESARAKLWLADLECKPVTLSVDESHALKQATDDREIYIPKDLLLHRELCSVTMYEMTLYLMSDRRERGLWFKLMDKKRSPTVSEAALLEWPAVEKLHKVIGKELK